MIRMRDCLNKKWDRYFGVFFEIFGLKRWVLIICFVIGDNIRRGMEYYVNNMVFLCVVDVLYYLIWWWLFIVFIFEIKKKF